MSIYLEVTNKKYAASTVSLEIGDVCRIGRGAKAEVFLPNDLSLAESHFMLTFDGFSGRLIDSGSVGGTFLNGEKVFAAEIERSCQISAGETEFTVLFENDLAKTEIDTPVKRLVHHLQHLQGDLFCLLDAARDEKTMSLLQSSNVKYMSLYQGESQKHLASVAPYLIELRQDSHFLERLIRNGWGKRWCSFFTSDQPFAIIRKHFRKFIFVKDERGETVYFRFYDPSIMRTFLPACNESELAQFFGNSIIKTFCLEDELPANLLNFSFDSEKLITQETNLS